MDLKQSLKQGGFSLAEVMVTIAVLGILSLAVIDQVQVANTSKRENTERAIINSIYNKVALELSRQQTCSDALNFGGKNIVNNAVTNLYDSSLSALNPILTVGKSYGTKGNYTGTSTSGTVKVSSMRTYAGSSPYEAILEINFSIKRNWIASVFSSSPNKITFKLNIVPDNPTTPVSIRYCFNDITTSITAAIRLSCVGNGSVFVEPTASLPYGKCVAEESTTTSCGAGLYIQKVMTSNGQLVATCVGPAMTCPNGQVISGFNASGQPICNLPIPKCTSGSVIVKSNNGTLVCSNTYAGVCPANYAIQSWNADGSVNCQPYYPPQTCSGSYVTAISPSGVTCSSGQIKPVTCPAGQFISGTDATGQPYCTPYINLGVNCPAGQVATGFDSGGNITCVVPDRLLSCNGSMSPGGKRFSQCPGTVMNRNGGTNSYCRLTAASCPAGFTPCSNLGVSWSSTQSACTDTNSACAYSVSNRYAYGDNIFQSPGSSSQRQAICYYWARNSGPWVKSCTGYYGWVVGAPSAINEVGCY